MTFKHKLGEIFYTEMGEGQPLLLVHDARTGADSDEFEYCAECLCAKYRVYSIDLPGFGLSVKRKNAGFSSYLFASVLNSFVKEKIKEPVTVIARGRGAAFSVMAAAFSPEYFKKIYMVKPKGMPKPKKAQPKFAPRALFAGEDAELRYALTKGLLDADYKRVIRDKKIPVKVIRGDCWLCKKLLS